VHDLKQHKPRFEEEFWGYLDQKKQAKIQWVQDPSLINVDNLNNVRPEAIKHFRNKMKAYLKAKIEDLENNSKIKNIRDLYRGVSDFKKVYQSRNDGVKDDLVVEFHSILARWRNLFSHLLNIHGVNEVLQTEIPTTESLVPKPSTFEFELAIEKLKRHKSPGIDQNPAELIKAEGRKIRSEIHTLINFI